MTKLDPKLESLIRQRMDKIQEWIGDEAPYIVADQLHLDANTPERAYWHYGYRAALRDVLDLAEQPASQRHGSGDTSS
jgi:hypothetical protein